MLKQNKYMKALPGFSLIETIIAIAILTMVITGPLTLSSRSIKAASKAKNNFIAANLAQEGIELIRSYRINNVLQGQTWLNDLIDANPACRDNSPGCYIDSKTIRTNGNFQNFDAKHCASACPVMWVDSNGIYNYDNSSGTPSIFTRQIQMHEISPDMVRVTVTISWSERGGAQSLRVDEIMHNWFR